VIAAIAVIAAVAAGRLVRPRRIRSRLSERSSAASDDPPNRETDP
jgi:hypothetical protein